MWDEPTSFEPDETESFWNDWEEIKLKATYKMTREGLELDELDEIERCVIIDDLEGYKEILAEQREKENGESLYDEYIERQKFNRE